MVLGAGEVGEWGQYRFNVVVKFKRRQLFDLLREG